MTEHYHLVMHETHTRLNATSEAAKASGVNHETIHLQILDLNARLKSLFGYTRDPIEVSRAGSWRIDGLAGLLRLNSKITIEVVPKFLNPEEVNWRSDFFLLAVLLHTGHLLGSDEISTHVDNRGDIASLVAQTLLKMHEKNIRRPIRGYKRKVHNDFSFDGDIDWDSLVLPDPDGFKLQKLELTNNNNYNAILKAALEALALEVGDGDLRSRLIRLARMFGPQTSPSMSIRKLPQRHRSWSAIYGLSQFVLEGLGLSYEVGVYSGPGFVISTWAAWELLCEEIVRRSVFEDHVVLQHPYPLGLRSNGSKVFTRPDIAIQRGDSTVLLIDAKYKTRQQRKPSISSSDLYEALAFLRASESEQIVLLYPSLESVEHVPLGRWNYFDQVDVGALNVRAAQVQISGLSQEGGFNYLVAETKREIQALSGTR